MPGVVVGKQYHGINHSYELQLGETRMKAVVPEDGYAQHFEVGADGDTWHSVTWREAKDHTDALSAGLIALGVKPEERVAIASSTRPPAFSNAP